MSLGSYGLRSRIGADPSLSSITDAWKNVQLTKGTPVSDEPAKPVLTPKMLDEARAESAIVAQRPSWTRPTTPAASPDKSKRVATGVTLLLFGLGLPIAGIVGLGFFIRYLARTSRR